MKPELLNMVMAAPKCVLYGASSGGARVYLNLTAGGVEAERLVFYDSNPQKQGRSFQGRPILTRDDFDALPRDTPVIVSSVMFYDILPKLRADGFTNCHYDHGLVFSRKRYEKFDERFEQLVEQIAYRGMNDDEFYTLYRAAQQLAGVPGAFAEVGVYKGGSAFLLGSLSGGKRLYLFDTFEGLPESMLDRLSKLSEAQEPRAGWLSDTNAESVTEVVLASGIAPDKLILRQGLFPDTAGDLMLETYSLVHLDTDLYRSTMDALEYFYPRLSPGGRVITHDYNATGCPGVKQAFDEYFGRLGKPHLVIEVSESQAIGIKD